MQFKHVLPVALASMAAAQSLVDALNSQNSSLSLLIGEFAPSREETQC